MASITYSLTVSPKNVIFQGGDTFSATMTRNETPPAGAYPVSAVVKFTNIRVWSSRYPYIIFEDYFTTDGLPNTSGEFLQVSCTSFSSNILNTTSASITATVKGVGSTINAFDFNEQSVTLVVDYAVSSSTSGSSLSSSSVNAGSAVKVEFSNSNLSSVYHVVRWSIGSYSHEIKTAYGASSASYTIPLDWLNAIPNATSGIGTVTASTYSSDGFLGSSTNNFTQTVPETVVPSVSGIDVVRLDNNVPADWNMYIQNRSGAQITASNAIGSYGSTISRYTFTGKNESTTVQSSTQATPTVSLSPITASGTVTFSLYVTDSRGRVSNTVTASISVTPYSSPSIVSALAYRCLSSGESNENGTYIGAQCKATYNNIDGKNNVTASCYYQKHGESEWTLGVSPISFETPYILGDGNVSTDYTYQVKFVVSDSFTTVERIVAVSTAQYTMFFRRGGTGVGIGKVCENEYALELNPDWRFFYGAYQVRPIAIQTDEPSNPTEGLIWLKPIN